MLTPPAGGAETGHGHPARGRLLIVSHPAVVPVNQEVYRELRTRGWRVTVVLPSRWRHAYGAISPAALPGMEGALRPTRVLGVGRPQRHVYLARAGRICGELEPDVAFLEAEPFAAAAAQWASALGRRGIPFGVQCYENIDSPLPAPVRALRTAVLRRAAFVAARSAQAAELARRWGARGQIGLAPPAVPAWNLANAAGDRPFTVGFAGRLVPEKGLRELLAAVRELPAPVELLLIGDGELRGELEGQALPGSRVRVRSDLSHEQMPQGYAELDVLVLPSRTTASWKEQFGRVIVEALWCGVPVVGSESGAIPWLIGLTGGGLTFPEGDVGALAARLLELREQPQLRARLASEGRAAVERLFALGPATDALERLLLDARRR